MSAVRFCTGKSYGSVYAAAAPFHRCEAVAGGSGERLRGNVDFLFKRFPRHEDPKERVGRGADIQLRHLRIAVGLKRDEIIGIFLHLGKPVHDEFIRFFAGESEVAQGIFEESGGVAARYAEAVGKVVFRAVRAFPVQVVIRLAVLVRQSTVRFRRNMPAGFVIRVGASERSVVRRA